MTTPKSKFSVKSSTDYHRTVNLS